jgi:hypothetical protein
MAHGTPQDVAAKWAQRASAAGTDYTAGINRVAVSPGQAAAAAAPTWQAAVSSPDALAKYKRNVGLVTLEAWQNAATQYGSARYTQGVAAKQAKYEAIMAQLLPYIDRGVAQIKAMPKATFEDRLQRSRAMQVYMHNFQRTA